ncbi:hypothetical protein AVEN_251323-1 [Araneus ventricosus]|uniref:Uncharacterized protein n=1 Tax=Araneus ventricosus TaxID=182803 RepID=A0A4Y2QXP7_ARAVE|nr:hypothetical protein AVEN_251323-1 [Araneus ventricosus]
MTRTTPEMPHCSPDFHDVPSERRFIRVRIDEQQSGGYSVEPGFEPGDSKAETLPIGHRDPSVINNKQQSCGGGCGAGRVDPPPPCRGKFWIRVSNRS